MNKQSIKLSNSNIWIFKDILRLKLKKIYINSKSKWAIKRHT